ALASNPFLEEPDDSPEPQEDSRHDNRGSTNDADKRPAEHPSDQTPSRNDDRSENVDSRVGESRAETFEEWSGNYPRQQAPGLFDMDAGTREDYRTTLADVLRKDLFSYTDRKSVV